MLPHPGLTPFDYVRPTAPDEVPRLLLTHGEEARLLMGGTDLLVRIRDGKVHPQVVVDVKHLPGMRDVSPFSSPPTQKFGLFGGTTICRDPDGGQGTISSTRTPKKARKAKLHGRGWGEAGQGLTIGAAVTMNEVARHPAIREHYGLLAQAAESVASYQLRNRATLGGNLCNASPAADTAPAVLVLEGQLVLCGPDGERTVPVGGFFLGPGQSCLQSGEFLTAVRLPAPLEKAAGVYLKLGRNRAGDLAIAGVAVLGFPDPTAASGCRFRIALASVAPVPLRAERAEQILADAPPGDDTFARAAAEAMHASSPIDDIRASAAYRRAMVRNLTLRALHQVWSQMRVTN